MARPSLVLSTICLTVTMALSLGEILVRVIMGAPWAERFPLVRVMPDQKLGWRMVPLDAHYTYDIPVTLNTLGFRGPEVGPKLPHEYRILAVGDSHIYGQGISDEALMTTVLQQLLNRGQRKTFYRVVNMGVRAYSLNQEAALIEEVGLTLEPDHVILFVYINDFAPTNINKRYADFKDTSWYMFDIDGQPSWNLLAKWHAMQLLRHSALLMWAYDMYRSWTTRGNDEELILEGQLNDKLDRQFDEAAGYLNRVFEMTERRGIRLTVASIPVAAQLVRQFPNERYQSWLRNLCKEKGIDYLDLLPAMKDFYEKTGRLPTIPYDGHYDAVGQRLMALQVAEYLGREIFPVAPAGLR